MLVGECSPRIALLIVIIKIEWGGYLQFKYLLNFPFNQVEILIFEFLIQQPQKQQIREINYNDIGPLASKLPKDMIEQLDNEILKNISTFYKLCTTKLQIQEDESIHFSQFEKIGNYSKLGLTKGKDLQNQLHINTNDILGYLQVLKNEKDLISNRSALQFITELEKIISSNQKERVKTLKIIIFYQISLKQAKIEIGHQKQQKEQNKDEILNFSSDEEQGSSRKASQGQIMSSPNKQNDDYLKSLESTTQNSFQRVSILTKYCQQLIDTIRSSKYINKIPDGLQNIHELTKQLQQIEIQTQDINEVSESRHRYIIELLSERELIQSKLTNEEQDKRVRQDQIRQMLDDNDIISSDLGKKEDEIKLLTEQIELLIVQGKSLTEADSAAKTLQIELKEIERKYDETTLELSRLKYNNTSLLELIQQLENTQQQKPDSNTNDQESRITLDIFKKQVEELQIINIGILHKNEVTMKENIQQNLQIVQLEGQITDLKREVNHYKHLYEYFKEDNVKMRNSIVVRQSIFNRPSSQQLGNQGFGRISNIQNFGRISNIGMFAQDRISRMSNFGRISNQNRISTQNLRIEESDEKQHEEQKSQLHLMKQQDILVKNQQLRSIKEDTFQEDQYDVVVKSNPQGAQLGVEFSDFWDNYVNNDPNNPTTVIQKPQYNPEYQYLEFDETVLYARDYLGLRDDSKIQDILKSEREKYDQQLIRCFSDSVLNLLQCYFLIKVFRINVKGEKARRVLFATEFNMYIFENEKHLKLTRQFPLEKITRLIFSESSPILCCLSIKGSDDYLIETFKRIELNEYLTNTLGNKNKPLYELQFKVSFTVTFKGTKTPKKIEEISNGIYISGSKQSTYKISQKFGKFFFENKLKHIFILIGFLNIYSKKWFSKDWQEIFVILCDVGLILFKKPGDMEPLLFVPIVDALVIKNPKIADKYKANMFKISYQTLDQDFLFSTTSPALLDEWHDMIHNAINDQFKLQEKQNRLQKQGITSQRSTVTQKLQV